MGIALASFCAYLFGQLLDIGVFQRLRVTVLLALISVPKS